MEQITLRLPSELLQELDEEADEAGVSRSEYIRDTLRTRENTDVLRERIHQKEERIDQLEEQLVRRSQVEEKVDTLARRVEDRERAADAPFFVRWARWFRGGGSD
jgi:metal-responsive CopG/Arc/MetJ family transcriptional regulator